MVASKVNCLSYFALKISINERRSPKLIVTRNVSLILPLSLSHPLFHGIFIPLSTENAYKTQLLPNFKVKCPVTKNIPLFLSLGSIVGDFKILFAS